METIDIRRALPGDAGAISALLGFYAEKGKLLARAPEEILESIRDFKVAIDPSGTVVGCAALKIYDPKLAEVRSIAVVAGIVQRGIGRQLLAACEEDGRQYAIESVFALTYVPEFFDKSGYARITKESLPQKIWRDCFQCKHFPNCGEIAVIKKLAAEA